MTSEQINKEIDFNMISSCVNYYFGENEIIPFPDTWECVELVENGYDLVKGLAFEDLILRHIPTNTYWKIELVYEGGKGYINEERKWKRVIPTETTSTVTTYEEYN